VFGSLLNIGNTVLAAPSALIFFSFKLLGECFQMMPSDIGLLSRCARFTLSHARDVENKVHDQLQTSGATSLVVTLRLIRLQKSILVTGMFSIYESFLQSGMEWGVRAFDELEDHLKQYGENDLAQEFNDYRSAINVLKHGKGSSLSAF
jgi:hypothetical protein